MGIHTTLNAPLVFFGHFNSSRNSFYGKDVQIGTLPYFNSTLRNGPIEKCIGLITLYIEIARGK